jgi:hypothetical protein
MPYQRRFDAVVFFIGGGLFVTSTELGKRLSLKVLGSTGFGLSGKSRNFLH